MDNLTHSLTGLALARAGLNRLSPRATLLVILSANAPDIDIIGLRAGPLRYLEVHRGYTHSLLCLPAMALICVVVTALVYRCKLPWIRAWLLCCIGVASHLALDSTNSYGVRLLLPFSSRWLHSDLNALYDGFILIVLAFAAIWPVFSRLVSREIGDRAPAGKGMARIALALFFLFDVGRATLHARAVAQLEARLYDGAPPIRAAALPDAFNPLLWRGVVETSNTFQTLTVHPLQQLQVDDAVTFYKPAPQPSLQAAKHTEPFRYFLYFARFPVWSVQPVSTADGEGKRIELTDLRFGTPGAGSFHCVALETADGRVVDSLFTYGSGADLGWGKDQRAGAPKLSPQLEQYRESAAMRPSTLAPASRP